MNIVVIPAEAGIQMEGPAMFTRHWRVGAVDSDSTRQRRVNIASPSSFDIGLARKSGHTQGYGDDRMCLDNCPCRS
jgi:hypothetical protein